MPTFRVVMELHTRVTTNRTQWPPAGSTTKTCPSRSRSTSRVGSRGSIVTQCYQIKITISKRRIFDWRDLPSRYHADRGAVTLRGGLRSRLRGREQQFVAAQILLKRIASGERFAQLWSW